MPSGEYDECPQIGQVFPVVCEAIGVGFLLFIEFLLFIGGVRIYCPILPFEYVLATGDRPPEDRPPEDRH